MFGKHDLKVLLRSGSLRFTLDRDAARYRPGRVSSLVWKGRRVHYRPGSSDIEVIYKILLKGGRKAEYWVPDAIRPRVIWDVGANIGATALYFAERFPQAEIHCFEPIAENREMLRLNAGGNGSIHVHACALGPRDGALAIHASDYHLNFGGFSFYYSGTAPVATREVGMRSPRGVIADGTAPAPDMIKIDVEGAEHDILTSFEPEVLARVAWINGELHSKRSFALLEYLSAWFDIEVKKSLGKPLFNFRARGRKA